MEGQTPIVNTEVGDAALRADRGGTRMGWLDRVKTLLSKGRNGDGVALPGDESAPLAEPNTAAPPVDAPHPSWVQQIIESLPLAMLFTGTLLSLCSELIGFWAALGYLMLVTAPVVHYLRLIEQRLTEIRDLTRKGRDR